MFFNLLCGVFFVVVVGLFLFRILAVNSVLVFFLFSCFIADCYSVANLFLPSVYFRDSAQETEDRSGRRQQEQQLYW